MFWAGIIGNELVGPFRVPDDVKMNSLTYSTETFFKIIYSLVPQQTPSIQEEDNLHARQRTITCCSFHR